MEACENVRVCLFIYKCDVRAFLAHDDVFSHYLKELSFGISCNTRLEWDRLGYFFLKHQFQKVGVGFKRRDEKKIAGKFILKFVEMRAILVQSEC